MLALRPGHSYQRVAILQKRSFITRSHGLIPNLGIVQDESSARSYVPGITCTQNPIVVLDKIKKEMMISDIRSWITFQIS